MPVLNYYAQIYGGQSSPDKLCLFWGAAANATSYEILYNTATTTAGAKTVWPVYGTNHILGVNETLVRDTTYYIWIRAKAGSNTSGLSNMATVKYGERIPQGFVGWFFSRWPSTGPAHAGERPYYMDGHIIGPVSEMADIFPWNVAGRQSPIGPSPGKFAKSSAKYPLPAGFGTASMNEVLSSGYAVDHDREQYLSYSYSRPLNFALVRATMRPVVTSDRVECIAFCEVIAGGTTAMSAMYLYANADRQPPYGNCFGLLHYSGIATSDPANIQPGQLYASYHSFIDAGVAYPSIRLGRKPVEPGLGDPEDTSIPFYDQYNPLLIRPEPLSNKVNPALAAAGVSLPGGWWTKTSQSDPPLDPIIVNAFWDAVDW